MAFSNTEEPEIVGAGVLSTLEKIKAQFDIQINYCYSKKHER